MFADDAAARVEFLHADVVEIARAMHRGYGIGLREDQQARFTRAAAQFAFQHDGRARALACAFVAQDAEPGAWRALEQIRCLATTQAIVAIAQKDEMSLFDPSE